MAKFPELETVRNLETLTERLPALVYGKGRTPPEKIQPNSVPAGLDRLGAKALQKALADFEGGRLVVPLKQIDPLDRYQPSIMTFGSAEPPDNFKPARNFSPFWSAQSPDPATTQSP